MVSKNATKEETIAYNLIFKTFLSFHASEELIQTNYMGPQLKMKFLSATKKARTPNRSLFFCFFI